MKRLITSEDLKEFKQELLGEIKQLLTRETTGNSVRYLKSVEVMRLLKLAPSTLQTLRRNGTLPYTKIGGTVYYDYADIQNVMKEKRVQHYNRKS